jgi:hypothetical protein
MPHPAHEQEIAALLEQATALRLWLEQIRGLTKDSHGRTIIRGLSIGETGEFLRLGPIVQSHDSGLPRADLEQARARYAELKDRLDEALQGDAIESLSSWGGN